MIHLDFTPPNTQEWNNWVQDCTDITTLLVESHEIGNPMAITNLYQAQKQIFDEIPFYEKCAYCESKNSLNSPTYVEHYRPKGRVRDLHNTIVYVPDANGNQTPHPGYYWLAYNWVNLLPTCWTCNTWHNDEKAGQMIGKGDRFPVSNEHAYQVGDEVNEVTLLINPVAEDPDMFLYIDDLGKIYEKNDSEKGKVTIEVFGLNNRESLLNARKKEYNSVRLKMRFFLAMEDNDPKKTEQSVELKDIKKGEEAYTMAARKAIADESSHEISRLQRRIQDVE